jgi:hypothetical protein
LTSGKERGEGNTFGFVAILDMGPVFRGWFALVILVEKILSCAKS